MKTIAWFVDPKTNQQVLIIPKDGESDDEAIKRVTLDHGVAEASVTKGEPPSSTAGQPGLESSARPDPDLPLAKDEKKKRVFKKKTREVENPREVVARYNAGAGKVREPSGSQQNQIAPVSYAGLFAGKPARMTRSALDRKEPPK
jgi:hypothetical protein